MKSYPVKENHICSAVSKILQYKQIDREISCYFITRIKEKSYIFSSRTWKVSSTLSTSPAFAYTFRISTLRLKSRFMVFFPSIGKLRSISSTLSWLPWIYKKKIQVNFTVKVIVHLNLNLVNCYLFLFNSLNYIYRTYIWKNFYFLPDSFKNMKT